MSLAGYNHNEQVIYASLSNFYKDIVKKLLICSVAADEITPIQNQAYPPGKLISISGCVNTYQHF